MPWNTFLERMAMSHYLHGQSAAALRERWPVSWRMFFNNAIETMRIWARRRQHRQELLDYMSIDHRAAADLGITGNEAQDWAKRPFWRP
jgi:uncharacterized protein YjiS (DUF1127 family)